jgi:hypothetical protein
LLPSCRTTSRAIPEPTQAPLNIVALAGLRVESGGQACASGRGRGQTPTARLGPIRAATPGRGGGDEATHPDCPRQRRGAMPEALPPRAPPHERLGVRACHRTVAGAARWHFRRRSGPHDGANERPARGARLGMNRAPAWPPQAGEFTVARTCVLIKRTSHLDCTCVLIICMSQATYGPWPRSDVIPGYRQNGLGTLSRVAGGRVTGHDSPADAAMPRPGAGEQWHPLGGTQQRCPGGALRRSWLACEGTPGSTVPGRSGRHSGLTRRAARVGATDGRPRRARSLPGPQSGQHTAADRGARARPARARAPC